MRKVSIYLSVALLLFVLTACGKTQTEASQDADGTPAQVVAQQPEELSVSKGAGRPDEPDNGTTETISKTDGEDVSEPLNYETLTEPPVLAVSTLNNVDRVIASCGNYEWSCTFPDGTTASVEACGLHPLEQQDHPILYTAFPAGSLPSLEDGENLGAMVPIFYFDFGGILPETISAIRWPASYIGNVQNHTDFENVMIEIEEDTIMLAPLGDGDYVYEVSAHWGEVGSARYVFRTLPQLRGTQKEDSPDADRTPAQVVAQQPEELSVSKGTGQPDEPDNGTTENVPSFSYEEVNQIYKENDPGVKCDGFYNTSETEVTTLQQVIDRAKNECTIEYDKIDVFYDNVADIWKVVFSTAGTLGGCQTVYLDNKGLTCLVIYGE